MNATILNTIEAIKHWRDYTRGPVVATNGCFDILHRGHVEHLEECSRYGKLIVGINSDRSVKELKGPSRPKQSEQDRAYIIACLYFVDAVYIFDETRATRFLELARPTLYCKGGDYTAESMDRSERVMLLSMGSEIRFLPRIGDYSTTKLIQTP